MTSNLERQTYSVEEAGRMLGISRNGAYDAVKRGDLYVIRIGKRMVVPKRWLDARLSGEAA